MFSSSNICLDEKHLSSFQPDYVSSRSDASDASETLHREDENMLPGSAFYSCSPPGLRSHEFKRARDGSTRSHPHAASGNCGKNHRNPHHGHQAKRARVENIIKCMTSCPQMHCTEVTANQHLETDCTQGNERIEELPSYQQHIQETGSGGISHGQTTKELLESQNQQLRQLQTNFKNVDEDSEASDHVSEQNCHTCSISPDTCPREALRESYSQFEKYQGWKKVKLMNYIQTRPDRIKLRVDVLKYELSKAVSRSVDYIFKSMPLLQTSPNCEESVDTEASLQSSKWKDNNCGLSYYGSAEVQVPDVQTEALSLVIQKPRLETPDTFILQSSPAAHLHPEPPVSLSANFSLSRDQLSENNLNAVHQRALTCSPDGHCEVHRAKFGTHWSSVKVRSKVNSRSVRSLPSQPTDPMLLENLYLHHVKIEPDSLVKNNPYVLNEGLSTNHLKKAKLMFFYTRYPSSLVLKMCFHDVQFTRCITSQLIKWFSNFREFYYIQMEKFARHALIEGVADVRGLTVGRESELFRALNMHYNKANDFQVPDRFLEVAEITLREFYIAISLGKDRDPSWKKAIYKVICQLDSDVPADFISRNAG